MDDLIDNIGTRLRQFRLMKGLTQEQVAEMAGMQPSYLGAIERGERNFTIETLYKIVRALGITFDELFAHIDQPADPGENLPKECFDIMFQCDERQQRTLLDIMYAVIDLTNTPASGTAKSQRRPPASS